MINTYRSKNEQFIRTKRARMSTALKLTVLLAFFGVFTAVTSLKSYKNHKVVTIKIENESQLKEIQNLETQSGVRKN
jgi:hypothetical protein